jgi:hypothetical protein
VTNPNSLLHHLRDLAGVPPGGEVGDGELLDRFIAARDEARSPPSSIGTAAWSGTSAAARWATARRR